MLRWGFYRISRITSPHAQESQGWAKIRSEDRDGTGTGDAKENLGVKGLRVKGLGSRVQGLGLKVKGPERFRVKGLG